MSPWNFKLKRSAKPQCLQLQGQVVQEESFGGSGTSRTTSQHRRIASSVIALPESQTSYFFFRPTELNTPSSLLLQKYVRLHLLPVLSFSISLPRTDRWYCNYQHLVQDHTGISIWETQVQTGEQYIMRFLREMVCYGADTFIWLRKRTRVEV